MLRIIASNAPRDFFSDFLYLIINLIINKLIINYQIIIKNGDKIGYNNNHLGEMVSVTFLPAVLGPSQTS